MAPESRWHWKQPSERPPAHSMLPLLSQAWAHLRRLLGVGPPQGRAGTAGRLSQQLRSPWCWRRVDLWEARPGKAVPGCGARTPGAAGRDQLGVGSDGGLRRRHDSDAIWVLLLPPSELLKHLESFRLLTCHWLLPGVSIFTSYLDHSRSLQTALLTSSSSHFNSVTTQQPEEFFLNCCSDKATYLLKILQWLPISLRKSLKVKVYQ